MATTNNVQGDKPHPTAFERQIQTLTEAVEHLIQQNHDLEEQLRRKNTGHNTQQENEESTNAERRDQEGLEGSNTSSRPERQDMSRPSITDMAPPHIVAKMQAMKEQMDVMMNTLKGRVSNELDDLVH